MPVSRTRSYFPVRNPVISEVLESGGRLWCRRTLALIVAGLLLACPADAAAQLPWQSTVARPADPWQSEWPPGSLDEVFATEPGVDGWQVLPEGLMYRSYLAGEKEPRFQFVPLVEKDRGLIWEAALGGRAGLLRYGTADEVHPVGWQFDIEGAVLARVDPEEESDLEAADFRAGFLSTWRSGPDAFKAGYYHLSSHVGDEFLIKNPGFNRLNYVRDSLIAGWTHDWTPDFQIYGEIAYAFNAEDGALPWEFQYGAQYSPLSAKGCKGAPFGGVNIHTREDFDWETGVNIVAGWQWRGASSNHLFRIGFQFYKGPSLQYSFVRRDESLFGGGLWFDY